MVSTFVYWIHIYLVISSQDPNYYLTIWLFQTQETCSNHFNFNCVQSDGRWSCPASTPRQSQQATTPTSWHTPIPTQPSWHPGLNTVIHSLTEQLSCCFQRRVWYTSALPTAEHPSSDGAEPDIWSLTGGLSMSDEFLVLLKGLGILPVMSRSGDHVPASAGRTIYQKDNSLYSIGCLLFWADGNW